MSPVNYTFEVQAMSFEKLPFMLAVVFTIGPRIDDIQSLQKFAKLISRHDKLSSHVKELVQGIIEGETRALLASMTMEEVFRGIKEFKQEVFEKMEAANQARFDVAKARKKGDIWSKMMDGETLQYAARIDAKMKIYGIKKGEGRMAKIKVKVEVKVYENVREAEVAEANAELAKKKAGWAKKAQVAKVEATKAVALRDSELQRG